ncbi:hypothetical protein X735_21080 [Mesorhizobium sp. L2C085B000]|nr:hypothetical protein X735_21080 [Mesorhizobium sp. L2C085B000]
MTIKGEMLSLRTSRPLSRPSKRPRPRPTQIASSALCVATATLAVMMPIRATMLPMERST